MEVVVFFHGDVEFTSVTKQKINSNCSGDGDISGCGGGSGGGCSCRSSAVTLLLLKTALVNFEICSIEDSESSTGCFSSGAAGC